MKKSELLVVIAIIASMLLPALPNTRAASRPTCCRRRGNPEGDVGLAAAVREWIAQNDTGFAHPQNRLVHAV